MMDINEIMRYLPHRYPFLLIDRVVDVEPGSAIKGYKNVSISDPYFQGHFPNEPIMPGVIMIEGMAQLAGILIYLTKGSTPGPQPQFVLAGVDNARFKKRVKPGDQLHYHVQLEKEKQTLWKFSCQALVDDDMVASASIINAEVHS